MAPAHHCPYMGDGEKTQYKTPPISPVLKSPQLPPKPSYLLGNRYSIIFIYNYYFYLFQITKKYKRSPSNTLNLEVYI